MVTDALCKPFSMGRNLFCVHSKKHLDDVPELKTAKMETNRKTLVAMQVRVAMQMAMRVRMAMQGWIAMQIAMRLDGSPCMFSYRMHAGVGRHADSHAGRVRGGIECRCHNCTAASSHSSGQ